MSLASIAEQEIRVRVSSSDPVDSKLNSILQMVIDWLKFAETKNGGAIGIGSGGFAIVIGFLQSAHLATFPMVLLTLGAISFLMTVVVSIASFSPRTDFGKLRARRDGEPHPADNLFYFGHIAKYSSRQLIDSMVERYLPDVDLEMKQVYLDLAAQVTINARITMWKLRLFNVAVAFFGTGILLCGAGAAIAVL